jgi:hypothetical protein
MCRLWASVAHYLCHNGLRSVGGHQLRLFFQVVPCARFVNILKNTPGTCGFKRPEGFVPVTKAEIIKRLAALNIPVYEVDPKVRFWEASAHAKSTRHDFTRFPRDSIREVLFVCVSRWCGVLLRSFEARPVWFVVAGPSSRHVPPWRPHVGVRARARGQGHPPESKARTHPWPL